MLCRLALIVVLSSCGATEAYRCSVASCCSGQILWDGLSCQVEAPPLCGCDCHGDPLPLYDSIEACEAVHGALQGTSGGDDMTFEPEEAAASEDAGTDAGADSTDAGAPDGPDGSPRDPDEEPSDPDEETPEAVDPEAVDPEAADPEQGEQEPSEREEAEPTED